MANSLFFNNASGAGAATSDYIKDVFDDVTLEATNNTTLTDTALTNPMGYQFNNSDATLMRSKTFFIKDIKLIANTSKWIDSRPTYEIVWDEDFPGIKGYLVGDAITAPRWNGSVLELYVNGRIGITGVFKRIAFLVQPDTAGSSRTATYYVDGVAGNTIEFGDLPDSINNPTNVQQGRSGQEATSPFAHATSNISYDLHDIQLRQVTGFLKLYGVVVTFDSPADGITQRPGSTYVNKTKATTTNGATMALSGFTGTSIGGNYQIQKSTAGYTLLAKGFSAIAVNGIGLSGTTSVNINTGFGGSFAVNDILIAQNGTSNYIGKVASISTDTLTMSPTMTFGLSGIFTRAWQVGSTQNINASLFVYSNTIDFTQTPYAYTTTSFNRPWQLDPKGKYGLWQNNMRGATVQVNNNHNGIGFLGASGFLHFEGYCAAIDMIWNADNAGSNPYCSVSVVVNGIGAMTIGQTLNGSQRYTIMTNGGNQWNSVQIYPGASMTVSAVLEKINFYERARDTSATYGVLSSVNANSMYMSRNLLGMTLPALGLNRRIYSSKLYLSGGWTADSGSTIFAAPGGMAFIGATNNSVANIQYYGKDFAFIGTQGSSITITVDGSAVGSSFNVMQTVATEGWHQVLATVRSGTFTINAFDYVATHDEPKYINKIINKSQLATLIKNSANAIRFSYSLGAAATDTCILQYGFNDYNYGDSFGWTQDAQSGLVITIQKSGLYVGQVSNSINTTNGLGYAGISKNCNKGQLSGSSINGLVPSYILATAAFETAATGAATDEVVVTSSFVSWLNAGDQIRPHNSPAWSPTFADSSTFSLARIG